LLLQSEADLVSPVRTPLNAVINYLEMALEKPLDDGTKHALAMSHSASKSLIYVIDDLLHLTEGAPGPFVDVGQAFDLQLCLEEVISPLKRHATEKGLDLELISGKYDTRFMRGDLSSLQRAVTIIVANAIEHTTEGRVTVEWGQPVPRYDGGGSITRISVTDTGSGLTERELDDIFQDFEQIPDDTHEESHDAANRVGEEEPRRVGVGLAFVARYVKQRNGELSVSSLKDRGSTFVLELPWVHRDSSRTSTPTPVHPSSNPPLIASRRSSASQLPILSIPIAHNDTTVGVSHSTLIPHQPTFTGSPRMSTSPPIFTQSSRTPDGQSTVGANMVILIADDNIINLQILEKRLSRLGHTVLSTRDGQECYDKFVENQTVVDFILMDLNVRTSSSAVLIDYGS
jgi:hypothetical protein